MKEKQQMDKRFDHWRKKGEKVGGPAPKTFKQVAAGESGEAFRSGDCQADPCSCTGCSSWD